MNLFGDTYRGKRVLVTGHTGFKGSWLSEWLLDMGATVGGVALAPQSPSHFELLKLGDRLDHYVTDVRDLEGLQTVFREFRPEIVFHLAAQAIVRASYDTPKLTFDTNVGGTVNLLEAIRATDSVRAAVFITSDKCYENVEWEYGYRETDRLGGQDPYSASKACAEVAISSYTRSFFSGTLGRKVNMASTRAGNVIGGGDWALDRIVPDTMRAWAEGKSALLRNPVSTRPWQHVLEPLSGYLLLGAQLWNGAAETIGEAFNFGPPANMTVSVAALIGEMEQSWKASGWHTEKREGDGKKEAGLLKLDCDKALFRLRWEPTLNFSETVRLTAAWYRDYYVGKLPACTLTRDQICEYVALARERGRIWADVTRNA